MDDATPYAHAVYPAGLWNRFWSKVDATGDCWIWIRAQGSKGYGSVGIGSGRTALAHRVAWELLIGQIPDEMTIDHRCFNTICVNPDHLEVVTGPENTRRARYKANAVKSSCPDGHEYDMHDKHGRGCRACKNARNREHWARARAEAGIERTRETATWQKTAMG